MDLGTPYLHDLFSRIGFVDKPGFEKEFFFGKLETKHCKKTFCLTYQNTKQVIFSSTINKNSFARIQFVIFLFV